jgi:hypothetical protein
MLPISAAIAMRRQGRRGLPASGCFVSFVSCVMLGSWFGAPARAQAMERSLAVTRFSGLSGA